MKFLKILCAVLLSASCASAIDRITLLVTVTNPPVSGDTLVVNAASRYATNAQTATTWLTNLTGLGPATTNLFNQITANQYSGPLLPIYVSTNSFKLVGTLGGSLSASAGGTWATLTLSTQSGPSTFTALYPFENIVGETNRTNQASKFTSGISDYATNSFASNATALANFLTKGASPLQHVTAPISLGALTNSTNAGTIYGGSYSNAALDKARATNFVNYGNAIRSEGSGGNSLQVGSNALASGTRAVSIGVNSTSTNTDSVSIGTDTSSAAAAVSLGNAAAASANNSTALGTAAAASGSGAVAIGNTTAASGAGAFAAGQGAQATQPDSIAIGDENTSASGTNSIAFGSFAVATETRSVALGYGATVNHQDSVSVGANANTTATNQIRLGTASETVSVPGMLSAASQTNSVLRGTNVLNGRLDLTARANSSLANGYNSGVVVGTNAYVRFSGPSGAYTNVGFSAPGGPQFVVCQFDNPGLSFTLLDASGLEATPENRILTGTGALLNSTNNPVLATIIYDDSSSRWRVISFR